MRGCSMAAGDVCTGRCGRFRDSCSSSVVHARGPGDDARKQKKSGALRKKARIHPCLVSWTGGVFSGHVVGVGSLKLKKHAQDCIFPYFVRPAHAPFVCMPVRTACVCACEDDDWLPGAISDALHTHEAKYPPASKRQAGVLRCTQNREENPRSSRRTTPSVRFMTWRYMDT